jgi:hypothetical protein
MTCRVTNIADEARYVIFADRNYIAVRAVTAIFDLKITKSIAFDRETGAQLTIARHLGPTTAVQRHHGWCQHAGTA